MWVERVKKGASLNKAKHWYPFLPCFNTAGLEAQAPDQFRNATDQAYSDRLCRRVFPRLSSHIALILKFWAGI